MSLFIYKLVTLVHAHHAHVKIYINGTVLFATFVEYLPHDAHSDAAALKAWYIHTYVEYQCI